MSRSLIRREMVFGRLELWIQNPFYLAGQNRESKTLLGCSTIVIFSSLFNHAHLALTHLFFIVADKIPLAEVKLMKMAQDSKKAKKKMT